VIDCNTAFDTQIDNINWLLTIAVTVGIDCLSFEKINLCVAKKYKELRSVAP
jgi:hypothetical protein